MLLLSILDMYEVNKYISPSEIENDAQFLLPSLLK